MTDENAFRMEEKEKLRDKYQPANESVEVDDYDPHEHRNVLHPTTNTETFIHMIKGSLGTGILAMPQAFRNAGLVSGLIFTTVIGALFTYQLNILIQSQYRLAKRMRVPVLTYPDSMKAALLSGPRVFHRFANMFSTLVDAFIVIYQLGVCCIYVMFVAANLQQLGDAVFPKRFSIEMYTLMLLAPFILILLVPNLKWLAPFSLVSNAMTFASFGIVLYYMFAGLPEINERPFVGSLSNFPFFFGTTLFAMGTATVVTTLENNMKTPKSFGGHFGVFNMAMFLVISFYVGMGFLGYWRYGEETKPSVTLNLPKEDVLARIAQGLYSLAIFISYGLQGYVPVDILWTTYFSSYFCNSNYKILWEYLLRVATVLLTFVFAVSIPLLGLFISLFGALCLSALGIAFPAIMDICVKWPHGLGYGKWILVKDIGLILIGVCGLIAGSYNCILEIVIELSRQKT